MPKAYRVFRMEYGLKRDSDVVYADNDQNALLKARNVFVGSAYHVYDGERFVGSGTNEDDIGS